MTMEIPIKLFNFHKQNFLIFKTFYSNISYKNKYSSHDCKILTDNCLKIIAITYSIVFFPRSLRQYFRVGSVIDI